jgi:hypothetical protein
MSDEPVIESTESIEPREKPAKTEKQASVTQSYFFPNAGQPFSCEAASRDEAEQMNDAYLKTLNKTETTTRAQSLEEPAPTA